LRDGSGLTATTREQEVDRDPAREQQPSRRKRA
jgi:hypothetical protein